MIYICSNKSTTGYISHYFYDNETDEIYLCYDNSYLLISFDSKIVHSKNKHKYNIPAYVEVLYHEITISKSFLDNLLWTKILNSLC